MEVKFSHTEAPAPKPIVFEQIFAEKPGGGLLANHPFDVKEGMAVYLNANGKYQVIKAAIIYEDAESGATTIKVKKGSGIVVNDILAIGNKAAKVTKVTSTESIYDVLTITLGVAVKAGNVLYQANAVADGATTQAALAGVPLYLVGDDVPANSGDFMVKLVNGANVRKETAPVADEVVAQMKGISKV